MKKLAALTLSLFLTMGTALADSPKDTSKEADAQPAKKAEVAKETPAKTSAEISAEMEELRQAFQAQQEELQAQQEQLQMLKKELAKRDSKATEANVSEAAATSAEVKTTTSQLNTSMANLEASTAAPSSAAASGVGSSPAGAKPATAYAEQGDEEKGPLTIRFKGISLTPGGFVAGETVIRQRALSDDVNTQFNSIPYGGNSVGKLSELSMTARQSRLSLLADGKVGSTKITGYYEADWLGTGVTSNNRSSNSYAFRQRQLWARVVAENGWSLSGGQMWSLATEDMKGIANLQEWIPLNIDPQYIVGFNWERQYGVRVVKNFNDKFALALAVENPELTGVGGRGFSTYTNTSATGTVTTYQNSFVFAPGQGGGLYNFSDTTGYSLNRTPDFILKAALDPGFGHYEVFGIVSTFQNRVYPCAVVGTTAKNFPTPATPSVLSCGPITSLSPSTAGAYNDIRPGGGIGASAAAPLFNKKMEVGLKYFYGDGTNRYSSGQLPELTLRPDGTIALIHGMNWLGRIEWHATPKLDIYAYIGGEYAGRAGYTGYQSVKVTNTPAIPGCGTATEQPCSGGGIQPSYPALTTTSITLNGIGGYGSPFATNTGCATEALPSGTGTPGSSSDCAGDTRYLGESTIGFWYKFFQGEKGRLQIGMQYSYFYKNTWSGNGGLTNGESLSPHAVNNMIWTSFRYYLP